MFKKLIWLAPLVFLASACDMLGDKTPASITVSKSCNVDNVNGAGGQQWALKSQIIKLNGWAVDSVNKTVPDNITLQITNGAGAVVALAAGKRADRPDVASHFKEPTFQKAGFIAEIDASKLPAGEYSLAAVMSRDNAVSYCPLNGKLTLQ